VRLVLALDTATQECAVALALWPYPEGSQPELVGETNVATPRAALTHAIPMIERLLEECGHLIRDVDAVVVGRGPGSFTGVRIGIATAKGLAQGLGVPLYGVGTLDAIAERFAGRDGLVAVVGDAMRREVYPALFRCENGSVSRLTPDTVSGPAEVAARWAEGLGEQILLAGDGLEKYAEVFAAALGDRAEIAPAAMWGPTGGSLLQAAWRTGAAREGGSVATVLPIYTRLSDAEEAERAIATDPRLPDSGVAGPGPGERR
jgi:N6-L-threonylcarbamoyladenine synthase/protein kinase Bud32